MTEKNIIQFNFSYYALTLLGKQMYTNRWSAISELVANGLDAGATNVKLYINSINKKKSILEIIDNGSGMSYNDLATKYVLIGRNKRLSENELSDRTKGRKGIGKLATLFLSKKYYIVSKKAGVTTAWMLDSTDKNDNDVPELIRVNASEVGIENRELWEQYDTGTLVKLVDVNMSGFAETKFESLKLRLADYYLLDNINAGIEVAYITDSRQRVTFEKVEKKIAFKNFFAFFENDLENNLSNKLSKSVLIPNSKYPEFRNKRRDVVKFSKEDFENISGIGRFITTSGESKFFPYELKGWIGIHSTINTNEAKQNDPNFVKNDVYKPNRLKLYVRDKLAVENFLEYLDNTQAMRVYLEGEISFDILDNDELEDISTSSREGFLREDERVKLLINILKPIINKLISERNKISTQISAEDRMEDERRLEIEREERRKEREARRQEEREKRIAEQKAEILEQKNEHLIETNAQLETQNTIQKVMLQEKDPEKQELFVHELNTISDNLIYTISDLAEDFRKTNEYDRVSEYIIDFKRSADRLSTIKRQFLKLGTYDLIGKQLIDIKSYLKSYLKVSPHRNRIIDEIGPGEYGKEIDVFEFAILVDNLISNAIDNGATFIKCSFLDNENKFVISSDTAPIKIEPIEKIFDLGISSKNFGTGVGLYLVKEICDEYNWEIYVSQDALTVNFEIKMG
ncbi:DNA mismatch repair protein [Streptococcus mitis]|uniref:DNA mismatch repair protein n=1 Tax=Streptococcus mitis TaxID=28037 RepID=A0A428EDG0_STRMT|nr:ATP-binding protein [Streptococcus mitis]RSI80144.1 DNA mismatch repair protein [Streptococcus mitis]RSJ08036.1 DNA mismatch repair protein [Streptococcus mitis]